MPVTKRFLAALLCLCMALALLPGTAFAATDVTDAATLTAALGSAEYSGNTVTLTGNVTLDDAVNITSGTIILNLAGLTVTGNAGAYGTSSVHGSPAITVSGANLTIRGSGSIIGGSGGNAVRANDTGGNGGSGLSVSNGSIIVEGGSITGGNGGESGSGDSLNAPGGSGGSGLSVTGGSATVTGGSVTGGNGGKGGSGTSGSAPGGSGGSGLSLSNGSVIVEGGNITGGIGGVGGTDGGDKDGAGGAGGSGLSAPGGSATVTGGSITGGTGGTGGSSVARNGGDGGSGGLAVSGGSATVKSGVFTGGNGGNAGGNGAYQGAPGSDSSAIGGTVTIDRTGRAIMAGSSAPGSAWDDTMAALTSYKYVRMAPVYTVTYDNNGGAGTMTQGAATGTAPLSYQWHRSTDGGQNFSPIADATDRSYPTSPVTPANNGYRYYCMVTGGAGSTRSGVFVLNVIEQADIPATGDSSQPVLWLGIMLLAGAGLAASVVMRRKRQNG